MMNDNDWTFLYLCFSLESWFTSLPSAMRRGWSTTWDLMWRYHCHACEQITMCLSSGELTRLLMVCVSESVWYSLYSGLSHTRPPPPEQCTKNSLKPWLLSWSLPLTSSRVTSCSRWHICTLMWVCNYSIISQLLYIVLWLVFVFPAVLLVFLWSLSQVHGSVLDWEL